MTALDEARAHLAKAREFLAAAEQSEKLGFHNAAMSNAVISGVNSKDAVCLALTGRTGKSENHLDAVRELGKAGPAGAEMRMTLSRLLKGKVKSQYQAASVSQADTENAIRWAGRLYEQAKQVATQ